MQGIVFISVTINLRPESFSKMLFKLPKLVALGVVCRNNIPGSLLKVKHQIDGNGYVCNH